MAATVRDIAGYAGAELIGRGGFGAVYRATDAAHGRDVAIKVLQGSLGEAERRRFDRERQTMGRLGAHPYIIPVYESGYTEAGEGYIVMELATGGSLRDRLKVAPIPWREAATLVALVADAIQAAHDNGVLHRDIKPDNILIDQFNNPKLTDFGIAAVASNQTATTSTTATLAHAAPELLEAKPSSPAIDIYALGSTLHTLISGNPPFVRPDDNSAAVMIARVLSEEPPDLRLTGCARRPGRRDRTILGQRPRQAPEHGSPAGSRTAGRNRWWDHPDAAPAEGTQPERNTDRGQPDAGRPDLRAHPNNPAGGFTTEGRPALSAATDAEAGPAGGESGRNAAGGKPSPGLCQHREQLLAPANAGLPVDAKRAHTDPGQPGNIAGQPAPSSRYSGPTGFLSAAPSGYQSGPPGSAYPSNQSWEPPQTETKKSGGSGGRAALIGFAAVVIVGGLGLIALFASRGDDNTQAGGQPGTGSTVTTDSSSSGSSAATPGVGEPSIEIDCPTDIAVGSKVVCSIFTTDATSGEWNLPAFLPAPEPIEVVPGEYEIFIEPTNNEAVGRTFTITATATDDGGDTASVTHSFRVVAVLVEIDCPGSIALNNQVVCNIISTNATEGDWNIPGFGGAEIEVVPGTNPIFIEPRDASSVGQNYTITATVSDASGETFTATSDFVVTGG